MQVIRKIRRSITRDGWISTFRAIGTNLFRASATAGPSTKDPFDEAYGIETTFQVKLTDLDIKSPNIIFGGKYGAILPTRFRAALECISIDHSKFTFVDLGSGKGRALLLAAAWPFKKIIGVEFARELHELAVQNIAVFSGPMSCRDVHSICEDATAFPFPPEPLVVYMYNPFVGRTMIDVYRNLEESVRRHPREVYIIYVNPVMAREVEAFTCFEPVVTDQHHNVYRSKVSRDVPRTVDSSRSAGS